MKHFRSHALPPAWTRSGKGKCNMRYTHPSGWLVYHCGHPTANWPYAVVDPQGLLHTSGDTCELGYAFRRLDDAIAHVERHLAEAA